MTNKNKKYRSPIAASVYESAEALYEIGAIKKQTMREFEESCLVDCPEMTPEEIKNLREREMVSQPVFATYLNVSKNAVSEWERGIKKPTGSAVRLLSIVQKHGVNFLTV